MLTDKDRLIWINEIMYQSQTNVVPILSLHKLHNQKVNGVISIIYDLIMQLVQFNNSLTINIKNH